MKLFCDINAPRKEGELQFALEEWIDESPFEKHLGIQIESAEKGTACLKLPFPVKLSNGGGVMHGGAMTSLADTAVAMAIKSLLPAGTDFVTSELEMKFQAPVKSGTVIAQARAETEDGRVYVGECVLQNEDGINYARFTSVFKVLK